LKSAKGAEKVAIFVIFIVKSGKIIKISIWVIFYNYGPLSLNIMPSLKNPWEWFLSKSRIKK
jgi:hypothetical protein